MTRTFRLTLWTALIVALIGLGAKLFDLTILAPAWSASPPESLRLMPYGPNYPLDPGDFFIPVSILIVLSYFGALIAGWSTGKANRSLLLLAVAFVIIGAVATPTLFWPMIRELYGSGVGTIQRTPEQLSSLITQWFVLDTVRTLLVAGGVVCHLIIFNRFLRGNSQGTSDL